MNQLASGFRTVMGSKDQFSFSSLCEHVVLRSVLITIGVSSDDDGLCPSGDESGNVADDDGLAEDCSVKDVSNRTVGRLPHLLKVELLDSALVRCDCRTFYTNFVL